MADKKFEKNNYFYGKLMLVEDFIAEQKYCDDKRYMINRLILGSGLVCGFSDIKCTPSTEGKINVNFGDGGVALDCYGQEIVVLSPEVKESGPLKVNDKDFYYLYLKSSPVQDEKVRAASNTSSCEEQCNYNKIIEDFEVVVETETPEIVPCSIKEISGTVKNAEKNTITLGDGDTISSINDACKDIWIIITEGTGKGQVRKITEYNESTKVVTVDSDWETNPDATSLYQIDCCQDFSVEANSKQTKENIKQWIEKKINASCCSCEKEKQKVFIAAIDKSLNINLEETRKYRSFVYNNKMLYKLLTCHISNFYNPHQTTAKQVGALKSIDGVSNPGADVDLVQKDSIQINSDDANNTITIGETHSSRTDNPHKTTAEQVGALKSIDGVSNPGSNVDLVQKDSIQIDSDDVNNTITIGETHSSLTDNPHQTTAEQVGALKSIDGVSNPGSNIDLVQKDSIQIDSDDTNKTITIGETHSSRTDNPHQTTAEQVGALKSINSVISKDGNINLVKDNSIVITVKNKSIIIGENHSSQTNNPHGTTAEQIGALSSINKVTSPDGNITLTSSTISINHTSGNEIDLEYSDTRIDELEKNIRLIQCCLLHKSLKHKLKIFTKLSDKNNYGIAGDKFIEIATAIVNLVKTALKEKVYDAYDKPDPYLNSMKNILDLERSLKEVLEKFTTETVNEYTDSVTELEKALDSGYPICIAGAQDEVCEMAERLEQKAE